MRDKTFATGVKPKAEQVSVAKAQGRHAGRGLAALRETSRVLTCEMPVRIVLSFYEQIAVEMES